MAPALTTISSPDGITWASVYNAVYDPTAQWPIGGGGSFFLAQSVAANEAAIVIGASTYAAAPYAMCRSTDGVNFSGVANAYYDSGLNPGVPSVRWIESMGLFHAVGQFDCPGLPQYTEAATGALQTTSDDDGVTWLSAAGTASMSLPIPGFSIPYYKILYFSESAFADCGGIAYCAGAGGLATNATFGTGDPTTWTYTGPESVVPGYEAIGWSFTAGDGSQAVQWVEWQDSMGNWNANTFGFDGAAWTAAANPLPITYDAAGLPSGPIFFNGSYWLTVAPYSNGGPITVAVMTATDPVLTGWTVVGTIPYVGGSAVIPNSLAWDGTNWVLAATAGAGSTTFRSSDDGATWTQHGTPLSGGYLNSIVWAPGPGLFIGVGVGPIPRGGWTIGDVNWSGSGWTVGTTP